MKLTTIFVTVLCAILTISSCNPHETEPNTSGEDLQTVITPSISEGKSDADIQKSIEQTKIDIEQALLDNYDVLAQIVSFLENEVGTYVCVMESGELVIRARYEDRPGRYNVDAIDVELAKQIVFVLTDLGFSGIGEEEDCVSFSKPGGSLRGGRYDQGLLCNKSNAGENKIQEWDGGMFGEHVHIKDEWFYFYSWNNT